MQEFHSTVPFDDDRIHAAAVYCSDGRFGEHFDEFLQHFLQLPRYDRVAVPGGSACLASHFDTYREEEATVSNLKFLVRAHELERVVLISHENCAFYTQRLRTSPLQLETRQRDDLHKAIRRVQGFAHHLQVDAFFARLRAGEVVFEPVSVTS